MSDDYRPCPGCGDAPKDGYEFEGPTDERNPPTLRCPGCGALCRYSIEENTLVRVTATDGGTGYRLLRCGDGFEVGSPASYPGYDVVEYEPCPTGRRGVSKSAVRAVVAQVVGEDLIMNAYKSHTQQVNIEVDHDVALEHLAKAVEIFERANLYVTARHDERFENDVNPWRLQVHRKRNVSHTTDESTWWREAGLEDDSGGDREQQSPED